MFINRRKKGYGWYAKVESTDYNTNAVRTAYINFAFNKGCEPAFPVEDENNSVKGNLYFIDDEGNRRKITPVAKEYNGAYVEFRLGEIENPNHTTNRNDARANGWTITSKNTPMGKSMTATFNEEEDTSDLNFF